MPVALLAVAAFWLVLRPAGPHPIPETQDEFRALASDLIAAAEKNGLGSPDNPDFLRLTEEDGRAAGLLAGVLGRLAGMRRDNEADIRHAFTALARGDPDPAGDILARRAFELEAASARFGAAGEDEGARMDAFGEASLAFAEQGALMRLYDRDAALSAYRKAAQLAVDPVDGWMRFGHVAVHLGALDEASYAYGQVLGLIDPFEDWQATAMALGGLGFVSLSRGDLDRAVAFQHEAVRMTEMSGAKPRVAAVYAQLGLIQLAAGDLETAAASFDKALRLEQELGRADAIAWVRGKLALLDRARQ